LKEAVANEDLLTIKGMIIFNRNIMLKETIYENLSTKHLSIKHLPIKYLSAESLYKIFEFVAELPEASQMLINFQKNIIKFDRVDFFELSQSIYLANYSILKSYNNVVARQHCFFTYILKSKHPYQIGEFNASKILKFLQHQHTFPTSHFSPSINENLVVMGLASAGCDENTTYERLENYLTDRQKNRERYFHGEVFNYKILQQHKFESLKLFLLVHKHTTQSATLNESKSINFNKQMWKNIVLKQKDGFDEVISWLIDNYPVADTGGTGVSTNLMVEDFMGCYYENYGTGPFIMKRIGIDNFIKLIKSCKNRYDFKNLYEEFYRVEEIDSIETFQSLILHKVDLTAFLSHTLVSEYLNYVNIGYLHMKAVERLATLRSFFSDHLPFPTPVSELILTF
jgi:hypothetical protein